MPSDPRIDKIQANLRLALGRTLNKQYIINVDGDLYFMINHLTKSPEETLKVIDALNPGEIIGGLNLITTGLSEDLEVLKKFKNLKFLQLINDLHSPDTITKLPATLLAFDRLEGLVIVDRNTFDLPADLARQLPIKRLGIQQAKKIPKTITELPELQSLGIDKTKLIKLPQWISQLKKLQSMRLMYNYSLEYLPATIGKLKNLVSLRIMENISLDAIPKEIGDLTNLNLLMISGNRDLRYIPDSIGNLSNLESLIITHNRHVRHLPIPIGRLTKLRELIITGNTIQRIPYTIGKLSNLKRLHLQENHLTSLPDEIGNLTSLEVLNLSKNNLSTIPASIGKLNLRELYIGGNPIRSIPQAIKDMELEGSDFAR